MSEFNGTIFTNLLKFIFALIFFPILALIISKMVLGNIYFSMIFSVCIFIVILLVQFFTSQKIFIQSDGLKVVSKLKSSFVLWENIVEVSCFPDTAHLCYYIKSNTETMKVYIPANFNAFEEQVVNHAHLSAVQTDNTSSILNKVISTVPNNPTFRRWTKS